MIVGFDKTEGDGYTVIFLEKGVRARRHGPKWVLAVATFTLSTCYRAHYLVFWTWFSLKNFKMSIGQRPRG